MRRLLYLVLTACAVATIATAPNAATANILRNASFTQCTNAGIPDWWGTNAPEHVSNWPGNYHTVPDSPVPGTQALMLRNVEGEPGWYVQSHVYHDFKPDADYTLAVWLKGDADALPVEVGMCRATTTITVTREWRRYTWTTPPGKRSWQDTIRFSLAKGTLWIAAPVWVIGATALEFALNPLDLRPNQPGTPQAPPGGVSQPLPTATVSYLPGKRPATLTAGLTDPFWQGANTLQPFVNARTADAATVPTEVHLAANEYSLFIAFDCAQPDMANAQITGRGHDAAVFAGESVEWFIAPEGAAAPYYHFAVNPDGAQFDEEGQNPSWNAKWDVKTQKLADRWVAAIRIPWAEIPFGVVAGSIWHMNFCRHASATVEEFSAWSETGGSSHTPERFGTVMVPGDAVSRYHDRGKSLAATEATSAAATRAAGLTALFGRSYYTTEKQARLRIECGNGRATAATAVVGGKTLSVALSASPSGKSGEIAIPLDGLPIGETPVRVTVTGASDLSWQDKLVKLADKPYGCKIDRFARCFIVAGKPFIPYCMGLHSIRQLDRLQDIKDHGFNTVQASFPLSLTDAELQSHRPNFEAFLAACHKLGLKIIWSSARGKDSDKLLSGLTANMKAFGADDSIIAWYTLDEPEGWWQAEGHQESDLAQFHRAIAAADPYRPNFLNSGHWRSGHGGYGGLEASDVGSTGRYPFGREDAMKAMDDLARLVASDCWPVGQPESLWLQLYGYDDAIREPTPAEQRCQAYLCLIGGARSLLYFVYKPMCVAMWDSMLPLGKEIEALTPVLATPPPERAIAVDTDKIRCMLRLVEGKWYVVCANRTSETVKATFDLASLKVTGPAGVMFGEQSVPIAGGKLADVFPPLATRVYVITATN